MESQTGRSEELIDKLSRVPLYYQVSTILRKRIESGVYMPGEFIPTEEELQATFDVSRATIRQAVSELVYSGLVDRRRPKGTVVLDPVPETDFNDLSFTREIMDSGLDLRTEITEFEHIPAPESVHRRLDLQENDTVTRIERIRYVDGHPVAVENWYGPDKFLPGIRKDMFKESGIEQSTYYVLQKRFRVKIGRSEDVIAPVGTQKREARLLNVHPGHPALLRERVSYAEDERAVAYADGVYLIRLKFFYRRRAPSSAS